MHTPTVLLADNDEIFLQITAEYLGRKGFKVIIADNPESARHLLEKEPLDLALIDFRLVKNEDPFDQSGLYLAREAINKAGVPSILLTEYDDRVDQVVVATRPKGEGPALTLRSISKKEGLDRLFQEMNLLLGQQPLKKATSRSR